MPEHLWNEAYDRGMRQYLLNTLDWETEDDCFCSRSFTAGLDWLERNSETERFMLWIDTFDPHEPWLPPPHYRELYLSEDGHEQVVSAYGDMVMDPALLARTRANYSGEVTMCDRWFGHFVESMRVLGLLDDTMLIFTSDHGHSIGDRDYMGKRGYPAAPEVYDVPLMIRFPKGEHGGKTSDIFVTYL